MAMQYDVSSAHLNSNGLIYVGRARVKGLIITSTAAGGIVNIWDSVTANVAATYEQAATLVTVTLVAHGLATGNKVGIAFSSANGVSATNGNYVITVLTSSTFTLTDINSRTIGAGTACSFVSANANTNTQWHFSIDTTSAGTTNVVIPGEGMLMETGVYISMTTTTIPAVTIFYG